MNAKGFRLALGLAAWGMAAATARSQPWTVFEDSQSGSVCGVVNIANGEMVVLNFTGELVDVSVDDVLLCGTFVEEDLTVFVDGEPFGFIDFFTDGDGLASLWWVLDESGEAVELDDQFNPRPGGVFPEDFLDVPCDAAEFWDGPLDDDFIFDGDLDGVDDCIDLCPETPLEDEFIYEDGCGCSEVDSDEDGVVDCFDLCEDTPLDAAVDGDGCPVVVRPPGGGGGGGGGVVVVGCGAPGAATLALTFLGFGGLKLVRRRRV